MTNINSLTNMTVGGIKTYIRELEDQTKTAPKTDDELGGMPFFQIEEYVAELEKERGFQEMASAQ